MSYVSVQPESHQIHRPHLHSISILTPYFARHWRGVGGVLVLAIGTAWVNALEPAVLKTLFDRFVDSPSLDSTVHPFMLLVGILACREILSVGQTRLFWRVRTGIHLELMRTTVERLHSLPLSFHRDESVGTTMNRIERGINSALQAFEEVALQLVPSVIYLAVSIRIMLQLDPRLSAVVLAFAPLPALVGVLATREQVRRERTLMHRWTRIFGRFNEMLTGIVVVKSFSMEEVEKQRFVEGVKDVNRVVLRGVATDTRMTAIKNSIAAGARICVLAIGGLLVMKGQVTIGTIVAFASYVSGLFQPLQTLTGTYQTLCKAAVSVNLGLNVLDAQDCIGDEPGASDADSLKGEIEFRGVHFSYRPGAPVLNDVSLHVHPGEVVALVGPSGAGKSTLMALLQRLYDPTSGAILIDGRDIKSYKQRSLRSRIGVVLQENLLFNDTISNNIAFGTPAATQDDIERAARAAHAHEFITAFPEGYLTGTGERGSRLSGGERQRVAIARTLLKDASILVFDEATSALDPESEEKVQEALSGLARGRTTFVIAHRLSTVLFADRIVVLKNGAILETGTHSELMAQSGYYASLVSRQVSRFDIESSPRAVLNSTADESEAEDMPEPSFASSR